MTHRRILYIGNKNYSSWSLRPWLFLKQADLAFDEVRIAMFTDGSREALDSISPAGRVPVLRDHDLLIWDSMAIMEHVAECHPEAGGWPEDPAARVWARSVSNEMHAGFKDLRNLMPMDIRKMFAPEVVPLEGGLAKDVNRIRQIWRRCRTQYAQQGPFLFGKFTIADAVYAPVATRFRSYGVVLEGLEEAYCQALLDLPAMQAWIEAGRHETEYIDYRQIPV